MTPTTAELEAELERLRTDTVHYARELVKIAPKTRSRGIIPLEANAAQLALDGALEEQRAAGKRMRAIILKARQTGMSTWTQAKMIQRSTLTPRHNTVVVADNIDTGAKIYAIGERIYTHLPNDPDIKPPIRSHRHARRLHFGQPGAAWMDQAIYPDSTYWVDTATEFASGRGGTYHGLHLSEYAFWPQPQEKLKALGQAVPDDPDTLIIIESTANGFNHFKELWDAAVAGDNSYAPIFWPWWKHEEYTLPFANESERQDFRVGDTDQSPWAERELDLVDPGPVDSMTGEHVPLTLEQLHWRRRAIADPERGAGNINTFNQEYPTEPEDAFLATGAKVFDSILVTRALRQAEETDPRVGPSGPLRGTFTAEEQKLVAGRHGLVERPIGGDFKPARELLPGEAADWRIWLPAGEDGKPEIPEEDVYVMGVDVSGGIPESDEEITDADPAYHAIEVINHRSREQVAEYRSRVDADLLSDQCLMAAEVFNQAIVAVEMTGGYGGPIARRLWLDWHYPMTYRRQQYDAKAEREVNKLGWDTTKSTKPGLIAEGAELLREGNHGMKSTRLAREFLTYIRNSAGREMPEKGKFADLLMSYLIAQFIASVQPITKRAKPREGARAHGRPRRATDPAGYSGLAGVRR